jgi:hypothetical protein
VPSPPVMEQLPHPSSDDQCVATAAYLHRPLRVGLEAAGEEEVQKLPAYAPLSSYFLLFISCNKAWTLGPHNMQSMFMFSSQIFFVV